MSADATCNRLPGLAIVRPMRLNSTLLSIVVTLAAMPARSARGDVVLPSKAVREGRSARVAIPFARPAATFAVMVDTANVVSGIAGGGNDFLQETWLYRTQPWPDADVVVFFSTRENNQVFAFYSPLANDVNGLGFSWFAGADTFDFSVDSTMGTVFANDFRMYISQPYALPLVVLQELGHRWCCFVRESGGATTNLELLGRDDAHWSWFMDSGGSSMEGNAWLDNGNGTFTTNTAAVYWESSFATPFSELDLYIMGLLPASSVGPFFVIQNPTNTQGRNRASQPEMWGDDITISGTRHDFTIADVVAANGPRVPASWDGQFKVAFVLVVQPGEDDNGIFRTQFASIVQKSIDIWADATGGRSTLVNVTQATFGGDLAACDGAALSCTDGFDCVTYQGEQLCAAACETWCGEGRCCVETDRGKACLSPEAVSCTPDAPHEVGERCEDGRPCRDGVCFVAEGYDASYCAGACAGPADCPTGMACSEATDGSSYCFYDAAPPGATGSVCVVSTDCDSDICAGGHCVSLCDPAAPDCAPGTSCQPAAGGQNVCVLDTDDGGGDEGWCAIAPAADPREDGAPLGGALAVAGVALAALARRRRRR